MRVREIDLDKLVEDDNLSEYYGTVINEFLNILFEKKNYDAIKLVTSKRVTPKFLESMTTANISGYESVSGKTIILVRYPYKEDDIDE